MEHPNGKPVIPIFFRQKPINVCLFGPVCPRSEASDIRRSSYHCKCFLERRWIITTKGLTFIELLLAFILLTVAMLGFLYLFNLALDSQHRDTQEMIANNLAQGFMAEIMTKDFVDPQWPSVTALGPNVGETTGRSSFDDIDDYNLWDESPPETISLQPMDGTGGRPDYSVFRRSVIVTHCIIDAGNNIIDVLVPTDYKKVTVTVSCPYIKNIIIEELKAKLVP